MTNQPKALQLAAMAHLGYRVGWQREAAAELRRLHAVNAELLEVLQSLLWYVGQLEELVYSADDAGDHEEVAKARAAIKKAEGV